MTKPTYVKHSRIYLRDTEYTEKWLQDRIAEDPSILGLPGDLELLDRERRQERAGRLDLLLQDPESERRYELELMLGALDESHIIRAIEYWDIERRRYPAYEHVAVVVAEDVTGRFLNILSLLAGTIPLVVLQCNALQVEGKLVLDFVKVIDQTSLRRDDEEEGQANPATREYWQGRVGDQILATCDKVVAIVNESTKTKFSANYNRQYIGLSDGTRSRNFVYVHPKKRFIHINATVAEADEWAKKLSAAGMDAWLSRSGSRAGVTVAPADFAKHEPILRQLLAQAVADFES
jgi:hypothetical protein